MKKIASVVTAIVVALLIASCNQSREIESTATSLIYDDGDLSGFVYANDPNYIELPRDLGPHLDFQTEWWYYTGNVETEHGRPFGYQFTIFRRAIQPPISFNDNDDKNWHTNQIYFAHAAIADISSGDFLFAERFSRGAVGLAGAQSEPYEIWIDNWQVKEVKPGVHEMSAEQDGVGFKFTLTETQPPVFHGDNGFIEKSEKEGVATYYYSLVGLETEGEIFIGDERFKVDGKSWKDHEFGTEIVADNAIGWDWFAVQFDNGESLMYGQMRQEDDTKFVGGSWIFENSEIQRFGSSSDTILEVVDTWTSSKTGAEYPSRWKLKIPEKSIELEIVTLIDDAELLVGTNIYWEGPAYYEGTVSGVPISGYGYIELTGYAEPIDM